MRLKAYLWFELFMIISVVGLNIAFLNDYATETILLKSAASLLFVLAGSCGYIHQKGKRMITRPIWIAVICCMAGDVFLALDSNGLLFVFGVVSFAVAHILFAIAFCKISPIKKNRYHNNIPAIDWIPSVIMLL